MDYSSKIVEQFSKNLRFHARYIMSSANFFKFFKQHIRFDLGASCELVPDSDPALTYPLAHLRQMRRLACQLSA